VHISSSDPQAVLPADGTLTNGVGTFSVTLKTAGTQSITATDTANSGISGTQANITVNPAAASTFIVVGYPSPVIAGTANTLKVTAMDPYGNVATGYTGKVHFSSSDSRALLPPDYTFSGSDLGVHSFGAVLDTADMQSLTATDTADGTITGTQSGILVNPAGFLVSDFPSPITAGVQGTFTVSVLDAQDNVIPGYTGTVTFTSSDPKAQLPANATFTIDDNGVESFNATLFTSGPQSITVTDVANSLITGTQSGIEVVAAAAATLTTTGFPSPTTAGDAHTFTVTAYDQFGNVATGYLGTVSFSSSDPQFQPPPDYTFTDTDAGTHTFSTALFTAGTQSLTATDAGNGLAGTQSGIVVVPANAVTLVVAGYPSPVTVGTVNTFTVTLFDAYGNVATGYTGTVHFSSSDSTANLPGDYMFSASDNGTKIFAAVFNTVGTQSLTATDTVNSSITGTQDGIEVVPPPGGFPSGGVPATMLSAPTIQTSAPANSNGAGVPATAPTDSGAVPAQALTGTSDTQTLDQLFASLGSNSLSPVMKDPLLGTIG
jgi:hypothetical protein